MLFVGSGSYSTHSDRSQVVTYDFYLFHSRKCSCDLDFLALAFEPSRIEESENGNLILVLRDNEVRQLKSLAYTHSFDCEEGFIELCLDLHRFATGLNLPEVRFQSDI